MRIRCKSIQTWSPPVIGSEEAALLEPLACCLNGFSQMGPVAQRDNVVIIGDGPIGLLHLQLSRNLYHARTAVVGKIQQRIQKARSMGADAITIIDNHNEQSSKSRHVYVVLPSEVGVLILR